MGAEPGRWRRLSPAGLGALTVLELIHPEGDWPDWLRRPDGSSRPWPAAGQLLVARLVVEGRLLDEVLVCAPESGRCELHLHGGPAVQAGVEAALVAAGWRPSAEAVGSAPGSLREAVALASVRWGAQAQVRRELAAGRPVDPDRRRRIDGLTVHAQRLRRPAVVRLVGRPNAGKSTLFNRLLGERRALVSPRAGTTRDRLWALVALHGVPVRLEDGAGVEPGDLPAGPDPDLWVQVLSEQGEPWIPRSPLLVVGGKADRRRWEGLPSVSGRTGSGVEALRSEIATALGIAADPMVDTWAPVASRAGKASTD